MNIYDENELDTPFPRKQLGLSCASACPPPCTGPGLTGTGSRRQALEVSHQPGLASAMCREDGVWETEPGP